MSIKGFFFGDSKKSYTEIRDILNRIAEEHANPNFGKRRAASGGERGISYDSSLYSTFDTEFSGFLKERGDLEAFTKVMVGLNHDVSNPRQAVKLYAELIQNEKFEKLEAINQELDRVDKGLAQLLEKGLTELRIAAENRENR